MKLNREQQNEQANERIDEQETNTNLNSQVQCKNNIEGKTNAKCKALTATGIVCGKNAFNGTPFCGKHDRWLKFTDEEFKKILNGQARTCPKCRKYHFNKTAQCDACNLQAKNYNITKRQKKVVCKGKERTGCKCRRSPMDGKLFCSIHIYMDDYTEEQFNAMTKCSTCNMYKFIDNGYQTCAECRNRGEKNRENDRTIKICCKGMINNAPCPFEAQVNGYCGKHQLQFWKDNIERDVTKKVCCNYIRGCRNILSVTDMFKQCEACRRQERMMDNKLRDMKKTESVSASLNVNNNNMNGGNGKVYDTNKKVGNFNQNRIIHDNDDDYEDDGDDTSDEYDDDSDDDYENNGDDISDEYNNSDTNDSNLDMDVKQHSIGNAINNTEFDDATIRQLIEESANNSNNDECDQQNIQTIQVKKCIKCNKYYTLDKFLTLRGQYSYKCNVICLPKEREIEARRVRGKRDYTEYEQRPERKEKKKQWNEDNHERAAEYYINHRAKRIETEGVDEYLKKNAETMKKYRQNNPEKQKEINDKRRVNSNYKYNYYKREAENKGRVYKLTREESEKYFLDNCYYCGDSAIKGKLLNGIDRKDNLKDYTLDNCVTACEMCNMLKGPMNDDKQFLNICEHILTYLGIIDGELHPNSFRDYDSRYYLNYKNMANKRKKEFLLSELEFCNIVKNNCYLCGKHNSEFHNNGIDRIDNNIGYQYNNCKACCGTCNYMKKDYSIHELLNKIIKIYDYQNNTRTQLNPIILKNIMKPYMIDANLDVNKMDDDRKDVRRYVERYRAKQRREMGDEKYKEMRRLEKARERGRVDENGNIIERKRITSEEKKERQRVWLQKKRESLKNKYGDEEYRKMHAKQVAEARRKKKAMQNAQGNL